MARARLILLAVLLLLTGPAYAISDPAEMLPNPAQEARAEAVGRQLRCLVCQNESIEDSGADLARDLRKIVRERVAAGDTDPQITAWMVARYGDFVRLRPPFNAGDSVAMALARSGRGNWDRSGSARPPHPAHPCRAIVRRGTSPPCRADPAMIWLAVAAAILALCTLAPAGWALRRRVRVRGRTEASVALYRAQIGELNRDLGEQRISAPEHATAMLELQRRLLAASDGTDGPGATPDRGPLILGLVLVPMIAVALYLVGGRPDLPSEPLSSRIAAADARIAETREAVAQLRAVLATLDPTSKQAQDGEMMLGNAEASQGHFGEAAEAWRKVLVQRFDPTLAAMVADAASRAEGKMSADSAALYRQALAAAPADAPWRNEIEQRLANAPTSP